MKTFSLLHATARLPNGWVGAYVSWREYAANWNDVEYILCVDEADAHKLASAASDLGGIVVAVNDKRRCTVDSWNKAASVSTGKVLVEVADDLIPCLAWDTKLKAAIPDLEGEYAVWVSNGDGHHRELMLHPILTRAYYERPGRGGCPNGELLYPEYLSVGSDDDFTEYAVRDKVVVDARDSIKFEHMHPGRGLNPTDNVYQWSNRQEAWETKERVIARRRAENYSR